MADPLSTASGIVALVTFALQSSKLLYQTVDSFQRLPQFIQDLKNELQALHKVLEALQSTLANSNIDLAALELPLRQCGKACSDFDKLIAKCSKHSTESKRSFRDWARLKYLGDDVIGFQKMLAGYKATITIALSNVNIQKVDVTVGLLREYRDMIDDTTMRLEMHLEKISDKLSTIAPERPESGEEDKLERRDMQNEKESTEQCLEICAEFLDRVERVQQEVMKDISPASEPDQVHIATTSNRVTARKVIINTLEDLRLRLGSTKSFLEALAEIRLQTTVRSSEENTAERIGLEEELEGITKSLELCAEAKELAHSDRVHSFSKVIMDEDGMQVIVATMGDLLQVSDIKAGARSDQYLGQMSDESLQQLSRDRTNRAVQIAADAQLGIDSSFEGKYGSGVRLNPGGSATAGAGRK